MNVLLCSAVSFVFVFLLALSLVSIPRNLAAALVRGEILEIKRWDFETRDVYLKSR